jgi:anti-anti-sigma factor
MSLGKQMEVIKQQHGNVLELSIKGRLDNYWSEFLSEHLNTVVNDGAHHLRLDLSEVHYLSSAGIGVLVRIHQQLKAIQGTFVIGRASDRVRAVLKLVALESLLFGPPGRPAGVPAASPAQTLEIEPGTIDVYKLAAGSPMECRLIGDPRLIYSGSVDASHCQTRQLSDSSIAFGLGAFGANYEDCRSRFGEFVAVGGCCAFLPTDGTSVPDYQISTEKFVPEVQVLYGIECHGAPTHLLRFECRHDARLPLRELVTQCLKISGAKTLVIVVLAEASKVVGAALSSSPAVAAARLDFPQVRDWISFFPAAAGMRSTVMVGGVASTDPWPALAPFLRPMDGDQCPVGHFHTALFPHRPIQRGFLELATTAHGTFQSQAISSVLHLLNDRRPITGAGETTFVRGACWIAAIDSRQEASS